MDAGTYPLYLRTPSPTKGTIDDSTRGSARSRGHWHSGHEQTVVRTLNLHSNQLQNPCCNRLDVFRRSGIAAVCVAVRQVKRVAAFVDHVHLLGTENGIWPTLASSSRYTHQVKLEMS